MGLPDIAHRIASSKTSIMQVRPYESHFDKADFSELIQSPTFDSEYRGYRVLANSPEYVFFKDSQPVGSIYLKPLGADGHMVGFVETRPDYRNKGLGRTMYDFALDMGPIFSDATQTPDSQRVWYNMLRDGYDIRLVDPYTLREIDVPLFPDPGLKAISSGSDQFPVYDSEFLLRATR